MHTQTHLRDTLKISTRVLYDEFIRRSIPVEIIDAKASMLEYQDQSGKKRLLFSTCSDKSAAAGVAIGRNKLMTAIIASRLGIPIPKYLVTKDLSEANIFLKLHKNIVTKPLDNGRGNGVSTNVTTEEQLVESFAWSKKFGSRVIVQQHIEGDDIRLLIIGGIFVSAVRRKPAHVIGDGTSTIAKLIEQENKSELRNPGSMSAMELIDITGSERYFKNMLGSIPKHGVEVRVMGPANVSLGGTVHEATEEVNTDMIADAEKITKKLGLGVCGVDIMWNRTTNMHALIEINGVPGINMHNNAVWGTKSESTRKYVDWLMLQSIN